MTKQSKRTLLLVVLLLLAGSIRLASMTIAGQAEQPELASCREAVAAELELLATTVLDDGNQVHIYRGYGTEPISRVTIYTSEGELVARGLFLAGTENCWETLAR